MIEVGLALRAVKRREDWEALYTSIPRSPLLQDWDYGEAIKAARGWKVQIKRFGVFAGERCVGLVQVQRYAWLTRINRGPVWLTADDEERRAALRLLTQHFKFMIWAPNDVSLGAGTVSAGRRLRRAPWQSMWLDLSVPLELLSAGLDGKWRNQLKQSLRLAPEAEVAIGDDADWLWFCDQYVKLQNTKGFAGISLVVLESLRKNINKLHLLVVRHGSQRVAAGIIACHGQSATYLAGVNSEGGRKISAHNRMLWEACSFLRSRGVTSFDLGGVDFEHTPGVARFKMGMGGELYELRGEFLRLPL